MTRAEKQAALADLEYWKALECLPGWKVMGWTARRGCTYLTPSQWGPAHQDTLTMTGVQRDAILAAIGEPATDVEFCAVCGKPEVAPPITDTPDPHAIESCWGWRDEDDGPCRYGNHHRFVTRRED